MSGHNHDNVLGPFSGSGMAIGRRHRQGPTGRGFQLRDGSGSGIGKNISGRIGYGSGTGIFIIYFINRVLSGSANLDRVFFGYFPTSYLSHGT